MRHLQSFKVHICVLVLLQRVLESRLAAGTAP
jgi:hypothetical protein